MSLTTRFGLVAGTTALAIAGTAFGGAESDNDALSQIAELKQELAELKQQDSQDWLTEQRASEIRGIVQDVLADADTRTSFQNSGAMAGWNKGFFLASPDGNFRLNVGGLMQVRYTLNKANGYTQAQGPNGAQPAGGIGQPQNIQTGAEYLYGFDMGNTYLDFSGHVVDPSWQFHLRGNFAGSSTNGNGNGMNTLSFASVTKDFGDGLGVTVGQFRGPWLRETLVDDGDQLGMDRSLMNAYFTQGFDQGIQLNWESEAMRANVFYGDGVLQGVNITGQQGSRFGGGTQNSPWNATNTSYAFAGRFEYKISGDWAIFDDFTSFKDEEGGMMVGVAGTYERGNQNADNSGVGGANFNGTTAYGLTGDFSWEMGGANLFASFVWLGATGGQTTTSHPWGLNVQGGYFVTEDIEIFGRYEYINYDLENPALPDTDKFNGITLGANYFMTSNVKFTAEFGINLKSFGSDNLNEGFRKDLSTSQVEIGGVMQKQKAETDQWALRAQMQLMF